LEKLGGGRIVKLVGWGEIMMCLRGGTLTLYAENYLIISEYHSIIDFHTSSHHLAILHHLPTLTIKTYKLPTL
jgi:hypothetical protein